MRERGSRRVKGESEDERERMRERAWVKMKERIDGRKEGYLD